MAMSMEEAIVIVTNTNTATDPATGTRTLNPQPINFGADWRVVTDKPGEIVLSNITAPVAQPETLRIAFSEVADVFKNAAIDASGVDYGDAPPIRRGLSILVQLNTVVTDGNSSPYPASANFTFKLPVGADPLGSEVETLLERLLGALYETGETSVNNRVSALIHGAVGPVGF